MAEIKNLYSWSEMGQNGVDRFIAEAVPVGELRLINADDLRYIIDARNQERRWFYDNNNEPLLDSDLIKDDGDYYIYYNFHPSSGYKSSIEIEDGNFKINIDEPGIGLSAFWSEVIIFEVV